MSTTATGPQAAESDRARIERALDLYPRLDAGEVAALIHWFRKEASAHDIAMIASNEQIYAKYRLFRRDHIDLFTAKDVMMAAGFLLAAIGIIVAIAMFAPG